MILQGFSGQKYELDTKPFSIGGEGDIYNVTNIATRVAKVYHNDRITKELESKLKIMVKRPPNSSVLTQVAWPLDVIYDGNNQFRGFIMPKLNITEELIELYKYPPQKYKNVTVKQKIIIAENICAVISEVHKAGYVFGDFNPRNIGVNLNTGTVAFLDTDSYHIYDKDTSSTYRCKVCLDGYVAPELLKACESYPRDAYANAPLPTFTKETDNFALAIHIFKLLMNGYTPYNGIKEADSVSVGAPGVGNNAVKQDNYCFKPGNKPQAVAVPPLDVLPQEIADLFTRAFMYGRIDSKQRPAAIEWHGALNKYESSLKICSRNSVHQYKSSLTLCPWCEADERYANSIAPAIAQKPFGPPVTPKANIPPANVGNARPKPVSTTRNGGRNGLSIPVIAVIVITIIVANLCIMVINNGINKSGGITGLQTSTTNSATNNDSSKTLETTEVTSTTNGNANNDSSKTSEVTKVTSIVDGMFLSKLQMANASSSDGGFSYYDIVKDNMGTTYSNGIGGRSNDKSWQEYKINKAYSKITGRVVLNYDERTHSGDEVYIWIYGDGIVLYLSPAIKAGVDPVDFSVDISNVSTIKVVIAGSNMLRLVDCILYKSSDAKIFSSASYKKANTNSPAYLSNLEWFNASDSNGGFRYYNVVKDNMGTTYGNGFGGTSSDKSWQEYKINKAYSEIRGRVVLNYDDRAQTSEDVYLWIYGDDKLIYQSPVISAGVSPVDFSAKISEISTLKIMILGTNMLRLVDCVLYPNTSDTTISSASFAKENTNPRIYLSDLDWFNASDSSGGFRYYEVVKDNNGTTYGNGIGGTSSDKSWQEYKINKAYNKITGHVVLNYDSRDQTSKDVYLWIYGDNNLLYQSPAISAGINPVDFSVDLPHVSNLKVMIFGTNMLRLVDCILYK